MHNDYSPPNLTRKERNRAITDVMYWKCECEAGEEFNQTEFQQFLAKLRGLDDTELKQFWKEHVGKWISEQPNLRGKIEPSKPAILKWRDHISTALRGNSLSSQSSFGTWLDEQFEILINGGETDYGWVINPSISELHRQTKQQKH